MKNSLFVLLTTATLLTSGSAFAAPVTALSTARVAQGPGDRDFNYGYAKNHRVTPQEKARWEAEHRSDKRDDKNYGFDRDHKVTTEERRKWEEAHNYGYANDHKVTPQEKARWEAQYRR